MSSKNYFAAIDLGSRNCRLLIVEATEEGIIPRDVQSRIVGLGEGVVKTNRLSKKAMERALYILQQYSKRLQAYPKIVFKGVATEACRRAINQNMFIKRVEHEAGIKLSVIGFEQEALYALKGCESLILLETEYVLIFDIGGASTELVWAKADQGKAGHIIDCISIPCGVITVSELFHTSLLKHYQDTSHAVYEAARSFRIKNNIRDHALTHSVQLIGTSGTTTTIAALHLNLRFYDRQKVDGEVLTFNDAQDVIKQIQLMSPQERMLNPCIGSTKEDLMLGGVAIFDGLYRAWPELPVVVTDRGVRDGIISELIEQSKLS